MALAVLSGPIGSIKPLVDRYREAGRRAGRPAAALKVAITSHLHVGASPVTAREDFYPYYAAYWAAASARGPQPALSRADFGIAAKSSTALLVGSVDEVVEKIVLEHRLVRHDRFIAQIDIGGLPFRDVARVIELLATEVAPRVRKRLDAEAAPAPAFTATSGTPTS